MKGVCVGSATRRTKESCGVADAERLCVLEVLPGEQRNQVGWKALQSACVLGVLLNGHCHSHARGRRYWERREAC